MNNIILFLIFARFGLLAIGGGYVVIPLLYETFVNEKMLLSAAEFGNLVSVSQMTPGATSINFATYIGFLQQGIIGAIVSSLGFIFPSLILTGFAVFLLKKYQNTILVKGFLKGARFAAFVMVFYSIVLFLNMSVFNLNTDAKFLIKNLLECKPVNTYLTFNIIECIIMIVCIILIKRGMPVTRAIILSAIVGYGVSFL